MFIIMRLVYDIPFCTLERIPSFQLLLVKNESHYSRLELECFPFRLRPDLVMIGSSITSFRRCGIPIDNSCQPLSKLFTPKRIMFAYHSQLLGFDGTLGVDR